MIYIYTIQSCSSSKKVKEYLKNRKRKYQEIPLVRLLLDTEQFLCFLKENEAEFEYLFPSLSKGKIDEAFVSMIQNNPSLIRRPLIFSDEEDIQEIRDHLSNNCDNSCPHYLYCANVFNSNS